MSDQMTLKSTQITRDAKKPKLIFLLERRGEIYLLFLYSINYHYWVRDQYCYNSITKENCFIPNTT